MTKRFVFVFSLNGDVPAVRAAAPAHREYWTGAGVDYVAGHFTDRSGGLLSFAAGDLAAANAIVARDPFVVRGLVREQWMTEWKAAV